MFRFCGIVGLIFLVGCSASPAKIDINCDKLAVYARGVTQWKMIGATVEDISNVSSNPTILTFQQAYIRDRIFRSEFKNPARAYDRFYSECVMYGYNDTLVVYENEVIKRIGRNKSESSINERN